VVVDSKVYDLTKFARLHPGGEAVLYAQGIGASPVVILAGSITHPASGPQPAKTLHKPSTACTDTRSS
jgi:hypothetical protein